MEKMQSIFNEVQDSDAKTYSELLREAIRILSGGDSLEDFCCIVNTILVCKKANIPSKISNFLRRIFEDLSETPSGSEFILGIFSYLTRLTESKMMKVRKNSLFILKLIIDIPQTKVIITDSFLSKICERLFDKEKGVRKEALRVLSNHQDVQLNPKIKVLNLFKDISRHDPSHEVRNFALHVISIEPSTYNCIIERCVDTNEPIRKLFYTRCLPRIDLKELSLDRRVFLMEKSILEREFDGKGLFLDALFSTYKLPEDMKVLTASFYDRTSLKYLEIILREVFERVGCEPDLEYLLTDPSQENTFLARVELAYMEESLGRDSLSLPGLEDFVTVMYQSCLSVIESAEESERKTKIETMKNLFMVVRFYDFFNETARKYILSTIYKLLAKNSIEEIVEEAIQIAGMVCDSDLGEFIGSVINKNLSSSQRMCLMVCKQVMKHIRPLCDLHEAIVNEIVLPNISEEDIKVEILEIGFYYILDKPNEVIMEALISSMDTDIRIFHMCVDFAISSNSGILASLVTHSERMLADGNEEAIIPVSKLVLSHVVLPADFRSRFIKFVLERYYNTEDNHLKQYCTVFFFELFMEDSTLLLNVFCDVLEKLTHSHRIFIDQSFYWIANSKHSNGSQELFYNICIYLSNCNNDLSKRALFGVLERIEIISCWSSNLTKKILFCCSLITKRLGSRFNIGEIVGRLMEIDDGEPICQEDLCDVKRDLGIN